jgi:hypothetical protein
MSETTLRLSTYFLYDHIDRLYGNSDAEGWQAHVDQPDSRLRLVPGSSSKDGRTVKVTATEHAFVEICNDAFYQEECAEYDARLRSAAGRTFDAVTRALPDEVFTRHWNASTPPE